MSVEVRISHKLPQFPLDVSFKTTNGITTLFGPSGAGKTTVINMIAGLLDAEDAFVRVGENVLVDSRVGLCLPPNRRRIGYVFQDARLFPHINVKRNLVFGRWANGAPKSDEAFRRVVDLLGISALLSRMPRDLSGGEKQRVAIGRALLADPQLLLLDEPLAALDDTRKNDIMPYLERLRDDMGLPMLYVSHSVTEVMRLAQNVVIMENGRSVRSGPAAEILNDASLAPIGIRAVGAVLNASVVAHCDDGLSEISANGQSLFLPRVPQDVGTTLRVRIAAHDVILSRGAPHDLSALNVFSGVITGIRSGAGPGAIVTLDTKAGPIMARITRRSVAAMGLDVGQFCHAILKSVSISPEDVG
ncbi:MAG: molybdenum ABC transporter ATP-binding protein, partial [Maritimibacter sp.]